MIVQLAAITLITPLFFGPGVMITLLGAVLGQVYLKAQLSIKREMSIAKVPLLFRYSVPKTNSRLGTCPCYIR
jgi:hypothetical protein